MSFLADHYRAVNVEAGHDPGCGYGISWWTKKDPLPIEIPNHEAYEVMRLEVEQLVEKDPQRGTRDGHRLERIAEAVETYEKKHFS